MTLPSPKKKLRVNRLVISHADDITKLQQKSSEQLIEITTHVDGVASSQLDDEELGELYTHIDEIHLELPTHFYQFEERSSGFQRRNETNDCLYIVQNFQ